MLSRYGKESGKLTKSWKRNLFALMLKYMPDKFYHIKEDKSERKNLRWKERELYHLFKSELRYVFEIFENDSMPPSDNGIDDEIKEQLKTLGYL